MSKIKNIKVNLKELKSEKEKNFKERLKFIDYWTNYIKNKGSRWGKQQNLLVDSQID